MKSFLIIDDSDYKRRDITALIREHYLDADIASAESYKSGIRELRSHVFDMVILDISIPTFDGNAGTWLGFGGRDILIEMRRRSVLYPVIVVSQFDEFGREGESVTLQQLNEEFMAQFRPFYVGSVFYSSLDTRWQTGLIKLIQKAEKP